MNDKKAIQKAAGMIGMNMNDQQVELFIGFHKLLTEKGDETTLADIERVGDEIQKKAALSKTLSLQK